MHYKEKTWQPQIIGTEHCNTNTHFYCTKSSRNTINEENRKKLNSVEITRLANKVERDLSRA